MKEGVKKMHTSDRMERFRTNIIYALSTNSLQQRLSLVQQSFLLLLQN